MKKAFIISIILFVTYSCSSPLNKKYNEETLEEDAKEIKESGVLSEEESDVMAGWILRSKLKGDNLEGKTFKEIINEANDFKKDQEQLAEKTIKEEEEKRKRLGSSLTVAMYDKGFEKYDYQEYITYSIAFENKSQKDIRAFKGSITINDLFGVKIKSISLTIDDIIISGETFKSTYTTEYNQFMDEDKRLRNKDMDDLIVLWTPEKIIFEDGSTLE
jgi:hypothetical protein